MDKSDILDICAQKGWTLTVLSDSSRIVEGKAVLKAKVAIVHHHPSCSPNRVKWAILHELGHLVAGADELGAWAWAEATLKEYETDISPQFYTFRDKCLQTYGKEVKS